MRTVNVSDVWRQAVALAGMNYADLQSEDVALLRAFTDRRLDVAWGAEAWPELVLMEERWFRLDWVAGTSYSKTNEVFHAASGKYFQSLRDSNVGNAPATLSGSTYVENSAYWAECATGYVADAWVTGTSYAVGAKVYYAPTKRWYQCHTAHTSSGTLVPDATGGNERWGVLTAFDRYVGWSQAGQTELGDVLWCGTVNRGITTQAREVGFVLSGNGVQVRENLSKVWVEFRKVRTALVGDAWDSARAYGVGEQVYWTNTTTVVSGFYGCVVATNAGESPGTHAAKWSLVEVPKIFAGWLVWGVYADFLEHKGGEAAVSRAAGANAKAVLLLEAEADKLFRQSGQVARLSVRR